MRKIFFMLFMSLSLFLFNNSIYADKTCGGIKDVACQYDVICPHPIYTDSTIHIGKAQIMITNYNDFDVNKNGIKSYEGNVSTYLKDKIDGEYKSVERGSNFLGSLKTTKNYEGYQNCMDKYNDKRICLEAGFYIDEKGSNFAQKYSADGNKCPIIHCYVSNSKFYIDTYKQSLEDENGVIISPIANHVKGDSGDWTPIEKFYPEIKKDRKCSQTIKVITTQDDINKQKGCEEIKIKEDSEEFYDAEELSGEIKLNAITTYDSCTGKVSSYKILVNNTELFGGADLNKNIQISFDGGGGTRGKMITITSSMLKKMFKEGDCYSEPHYIYVSKASTNSVNYEYVLTDNCEEVVHDLLDADTSDDHLMYNHQFTPQIPPLDTGESITSCSEMLGETLTGFLKTAVRTLQGIACVLAVMSGMLSMATAVASKDKEAIQKAGVKCVKLFIALALILLLPTIIRFIGGVARFNVDCI